MPLIFLLYQSKLFYILSIRATCLKRQGAKQPVLSEMQDSGAAEVIEDYESKPDSLRRTGFFIGGNVRERYGTVLGKTQIHENFM
jgi:hypothetical protein